MNKKTFLEKLEKKLSVLNTEEKKDIISEYKGIIEEKVKHGMKEEEAVADFGDFDEFASEILSAYKINPHLEENQVKSKAQDLLATGEELIKEGAKKLGDATEKFVSDMKENHHEITIELIFELLLKGLCALVIMGVLTIPFLLFSHMGSFLLEFVVFPLDHILQFIWKIIISLFYLCACGFVVIAMFKGYIKKEDPKKEQIKNTSLKKKESKEIKGEKKQEKTDKKSSSTLSSLIMILLQLFILFFFLFPIWICIISGFLFLAVLFYFLLKGVGVLGLIICTISGIAFLVLLSRVLYQGIFHNAKIRLYPFLISLIFLMIGIVMTFDFFTSFDYIKAPPTSSMEKKLYVLELTSPISMEDDFTLVIDNTVEEGKAVIEASYYDVFTRIEKEETLFENKKEISFHTYDLDGSFQNIYKTVLDNLKQNKIYNYDALSEVSIVVRVHENNKHLILQDSSF